MTRDADRTRPRLDSGHGIVLRALLCVGAWAAAANVRAGAIEYPAAGNVRLDEGTIEIWFTPMTELYPDMSQTKFRGAFTLFSLAVENEFSVACSWMSKQAGETAVHGLGVSMGNQTGPAGGLIDLPLCPRPGWQRGEAHHVAFTWQGERMHLIVDGQPFSGRDQSMAFPGRLGDARLVIGHPRARPAQIILHAVRTSTIARSAAQLTEARPMADVYTLLLDRFDAADCLATVDIDDKPHTRTRPTLASDLAGRGFGSALGAATFVSAPTPGLALYPVKRE